MLGGEGGRMGCWVGVVEKVGGWGVGWRRWEDGVLGEKVGGWGVGLAG